MHEQHQPPEVVRWYTLARRFPQLIGRTPDGTKLWGGPYTITQGLGVGVVALIVTNTMGIWARWGFFGNALFLAVLFVVVVFALGRIPVGSRSPLSVVSGGCRAAFAPGSGRIAGKPVRVKRPRRLRHRVAIGLPRGLDMTPSSSRAHPAGPTSPALPTSRPVPPVGKPALTGVQSLLAGTRLNRSELP